MAQIQFSIVSKFSNVSNAIELNRQLKATLYALKKDSIYGYLAHNADSLIKFPKLWKELQIQKNNGAVVKIGYSLYTTEQLESLLKLGMIPDLVQLPYSLLDRKFESYFKQLKSLGVEIHARSVFLQGLYFFKLNSLPIKFEPLRNELSNLNKICIENKINIGSLALNFAYNNPQIDKVVMGVDSLYQLKKNLNFLTQSEKQIELAVQIKNIEPKFPEMLNPANWSKS
jgi:aryl-alcohol dehydrogenase-like predicted oxidoreductase